MHWRRIDIRKLRSLAPFYGATYDPRPDLDGDPYLLAAVTQLDSVPGPPFSANRSLAQRENPSVLTLRRRSERAFMGLQKPCSSTHATRENLSRISTPAIGQGGHWAQAGAKLMRIAGNLLFGLGIFADFYGHLHLIDAPCRRNAK
jgi:hypothetical protein